MDIHDIPLWFVFLVTTCIVVLAIEAGYRIGRSARQHSNDEKESPVSAIAATILALLAFMLAFTFGITSDRYDTRKELVREEAVIIRTAYLRADFLQQPDQDQAKLLLKQHTDILIAAGEADTLDDIPMMLEESSRIQAQLWEIAVANAKLEINSEVASLFVESLNDMSGIQITRYAVSVQARMPDGLWVVLFALVVLGMTAVGYQTAIAASRRSWAMLILALSFSIVVTLIAALDDPKSGFMPVSHQPLVDVRNWMETTPTS